MNLAMNKMLENLLMNLFADIKMDIMEVFLSQLKSIAAFCFFVLLSTALTASAENSTAPVPESLRSKTAVARVLPDLKENLKDLGLTYGDPIYLRIFKQEKILEVWMKKHRTFILFKAYPVCTYGFGGFGPKLKQGDGKAPEGFYYVTPTAMNPFSKFHLAFNLGYPNQYDRAHNRTGGALMVHGRCVSIGCYAMTNKGIEEIYALAEGAFRSGQRFFRVHIFPFKMTEKNMKRYRPSTWFPFWQNLKTGYDFFSEYDHIPPNVTVENKQYVFNLPSSRE